MIAFLGTGLLGSGFVRALRRRGGEPVHVWNRTSDKARRLEADGATVFDEPADAVRGVERVHLSLSDDAAVDDVLGRARPALEPGAVIVDHTTTTASGTIARAERWNAAGFTFVHAPVFMGPQNALESTGLMLVSGARPAVERVRPHLERMTGKLVDLGERVDAAAAFKLMGNTFLMAFTAGIAEMIGVGKACGIPADEAVGLFDHFNPGAFTGQRAHRIAGGNFSQPSWELVMARKDARLVVAEAAAAHVDLMVVPAIAVRMDAMIERGHAHDDWCVIGKDSL